MPAISETAQIARNLVIARATGVHYHVCHVSTKESIDRFVMPNNKELTLHVK